MKSSRYIRRISAPGSGLAISTTKNRYGFRSAGMGTPAGIDSAGRDVARMLYALRTSLLFGMFLVLTTMSLGTLAGAVQGYYVGKVDLVGQRFIEIWESLPFLYVLILLGSVFGQSFGLLLAIYAIFNWIGISYYMRAEFLRLRKLPFVEAARVIGLPPRKIIWRHMLPNASAAGDVFPVSAGGGHRGNGRWIIWVCLRRLRRAGALAQAQESPQAWWLGIRRWRCFSPCWRVFIGEGLRAAFDRRSPLERAD